MSTETRLRLARADPLTGAIVRVAAQATARSCSWILPPSRSLVQNDPKNDNAVRVEVPRSREDVEKSRAGSLNEELIGIELIVSLTV